MGLDIDAWYGSSWEPPDSQRLITESPSDFASQETVRTWRDRARALVTPPAAKREGGALVLGRFYPPHLGHAFLLRVAEQTVAGPLLVYVCGQQDDRLPLEARQHLVEEMVARPRSRVKLARDVASTRSPDQPEFWKAWADRIRDQVVSMNIRTLFASDPQARELASLLKLDFVLVDPERRTVPISATMIRQAPWEHGSFIHPDARDAFTCSVVLLGPEGAGKTTLSQTLAKHYSTSRAPEFVEYWVSKRLGKTPERSDFEELAQGEREILKTARQGSRRFFVADTDLISLMLWKQRLCGVMDRALVTPQHLGDLYLVLDDAPWSGPAHRDEPASRGAFVQSCMEAVRAQGRTPILISGPRSSRASAAMQAIDAWARTNPAAWEQVHPNPLIPAPSPVTMQSPP